MTVYQLHKQGSGATDPESSTVRQSDREIRKDSEESVGYRRLEGEIVRDLMDRKEEVLVCRGTDDIGRKEEREG